MMSMRTENFFPEQQQTHYTMNFDQLAFQHFSFSVFTAWYIMIFCYQYAFIVSAEKKNEIFN